MQAAQLKKRSPALKVIYSSGCSPETLGRDFGQGDTVFLAKPYLPPQLARTIRQCLGDSGQRSPRTGHRLSTLGAPKLSSEGARLAIRNGTPAPTALAAVGNW